LPVFAVLDSTVNIFYHHSDYPRPIQGHLMPFTNNSLVGLFFHPTLQHLILFFLFSSFLVTVPQLSFPPKILKRHQDYRSIAINLIKCVFCCCCCLLKKKKTIQKKNQKNKKQTKKPNKVGEVLAQVAQRSGWCSHPWRHSRSEALST